MLRISLVREVSVSEAAMLAGLLKGPERYNPRRFADRAILRRRVGGGDLRLGAGRGSADARADKPHRAVAHHDLNS